MPIYTVHDTAIQLSTTYSQSYQIRNSGTETIYLGKDTSVSPNYYDWSLSPGDTLGFSAETDLYVICAPGENSELQQQYGALGNFTPAPLPPPDIISRAANDVQLIGSGFGVNYSAPAGSYTSPGIAPVDVGEYSSLILASSVITGEALTPNVLNYYSATLTFSESVSGSFAIGAVYNPQWLLTLPASVTLGFVLGNSVQIPCTGRFFRIFYEVQKAITAQGGTVSFRLYGSNEVIENPRYVSTGVGMSPNLLRNGLHSISRATIGNTQEFISSTNGLHMLMSGVSTATGIELSRVFSCFNGALVVQGANQAGPQSPFIYRTEEVTLPMTPIVLSNDVSIIASTGISTLSKV